MAKRIIIFSSFPLFITIAAVALIFVGIGRGHQVDIKSAKIQVLSLIESRKWSQAEAAVNKLITDHSSRPELADAVYEFAESYLNLNRFEEANRIFERMIKMWPDGLWFNRARFGVERANLLYLIETKDFNQAAMAFERLNADFNSHPDYAYSLYWIAERYERHSRFDEAKEVYQQAILNYPDDTNAGKSEMGLARSEVKRLIMARKFEQAEETLDNFIDDFYDDPGLAESVYWITERFARLSRFEAAKHYYEIIIEDFTDTVWAEKSRFCIAQADVMINFIAGDYNTAAESIETLINDFAGHPDLPGALYWLTERFERTGRLEEVNDFYRYIADNFPESIYANHSRLGLATVNALNLVRNADYNEVNVAVDKIIDEFNGHPRLADSIIRIASEYYEQAYEMVFQEGLTAQVKDRFGNARAVFEKLITKVSTKDPSLIGEAYYFTAGSYRETGDYEKALKFYQKVTSDYSDYQYIWSAYYLIGECYEKLVGLNVMDKKAAEPLIEQAYKTVIEKYPDCPHVEFALHNMGWLCFRKGRFAEAAKYFEDFMNGPNIEGQDRRQADVLIGLGSAYENMDEPDAAQQAYELFLEKTPPDDIRKNIVNERLERIQKVKDEKVHSHNRTVQ